MCLPSVLEDSLAVTLPCVSVSDSKKYQKMHTHNITNSKYNFIPQALVKEKTFINRLSIEKSSSMWPKPDNKSLGDEASGSLLGYS